MDEVNAIAAQHGLAVIEDAAQSFGATYQGRKSCNLSTIGCTSFFPSKPLGCYGDGGANFTNDDELATAMREIRVHGQSGRYRHTRIGVGGRMDTIQCAVVLAKLERFEWDIARRIEIGRRYDALLVERAADLGLVQVRPDRTSVYAQYTVMSLRRDHLQAELKSQGIPTAVHYPVPLHRQPAYIEHGARSLPASESVAERVISLPMHPYLDTAVQDRIVSLVATAARAG
jgi:UDP-2-acetamido-2-deoxy-ribo-hexuluronate aminotransferase